MSHHHCVIFDHTALFIVCLSLLIYIYLITHFNILSGKHDRFVEHIVIQEIEIYGMALCTSCLLLNTSRLIRVEV